jgi:hypothetical protein
MKKFGVCSILSIGAFCTLLFSPIKGYADPYTEPIGSVVGVELAGTQGASYGSDYVYPYYLSIDSSSASTSAMCMSYDNDTSIGERWVAVIESVTTPDQEEAAWLFNDANAAIAAGNTTLQIADQWAAWEIFSTNAQNATAPPDAAAQLAAAVAAVSLNTELPAFYQQFVIYVPLEGWPSGGDVPQNFMGMANFPEGPTPPSAPEPSSLVLFGSGLLGLATLLYRRRRSAGETTPKAPEGNLP